MIGARRIYVAPKLQPEPPSLNDQIADYLKDLFGNTRPRRLARMSKPGETVWSKKEQKWVERGKYADIPGALTRSMLVEHAAGATTYAITLDQNGKARAGVIEIDNGGRAAIDATLRAAQRLGLVAYAFELLSTDGIHSGGHVWLPYDNWYPAADILAQLDQVRDLAGLPANTELWPLDQQHKRGSNQGIRAPFGYHQTKGTRGNLRLQTGEIVNLDQDLQAGFDLVRGLPPNAAPPHFAPPIKKAPARPQASDKSDYAKSESCKNRSTVIDLTKHQGGRIDTRAIGEAVKARYNAEHPLAGLLSEYGAVETRDGFSCPFCEHTHETTLYISQQGRLFSYSPRCKLYTTKGYDPFGVHVLIEHNDNYRAAVEALARKYGLWVEPQPRRRREDPPLAEPPVKCTPEQIADAERKRAQRRQEARATLDQVQSRASQDTALSDRAQLVLLALLETAGDRDWTRASVARLAELTSLCERYVHEGMRELEAREYITSSERNGSTSFRTFVRLQGYVKRADEYILDLDLVLDLRSCEARPLAPASENVYASTLDDWAWCEVEHGADELTALECAPVVEPDPALVEPDQMPAIYGPEPEITPPAPRVVWSKYGRCHISDGVRFGGWAATEAGAWLAWEHPMQQGTPHAAEPESAPDLGDGWIGYADGAAFNPDPAKAAQPEPPKPEPGAPAIIELDPLEQAPPLASDATYSKFIRLWYASQPGSMCRRTGKPYSAGQRAYFKREYQQLLVDVSPAEADLRWLALQQRGSSTRPRQGAGSQTRARRAPTVETLSLFVTGGQPYAASLPVG